MCVQKRSFLSISFIIVHHFEGPSGHCGQILQKNPGKGQSPPPPFWPCQHFGCICSPNPSLCMGCEREKGIFAKAEEISSRQQFRKTGPTKRFGSDKLQGLLRSGILECQMLSAFTSHWIQFSPKVGCRFQIDQFMFGFPVKRKCAVNGNILWWLILTPICKCNTSMCAMCQEENVRTGNKVLKSGAKSTTKEGFAS